MPPPNGGQDVHERGDAATLDGTGLPARRLVAGAARPRQRLRATFEQLDSPSSGAELVFAGTRDILSFAAHQVDQTAEALTMIVELVDAADPSM